MAADRRPFLIARGGEILADALARLQERRVVLLFDDDELATRAHAHLPTGAMVARYDLRIEGLPVDAACDAAAIFVAMRDGGLTARTLRTLELPAPVRDFG